MMNLQLRIKNLKALKHIARVKIEVKKIRHRNKDTCAGGRNFDKAKKIMM
jgi:hypothetical protein